MWLSSNLNRHFESTVCLASCTHDTASPWLSIHCTKVIFPRNRVPHVHISRGPSLDPNDNRQLAGNIRGELGWHMRGQQFI